MSETLQTLNGVSFQRCQLLRPSSNAYPCDEKQSLLPAIKQDNHEGSLPATIPYKTSYSDIMNAQERFTRS